MNSQETKTNEQLACSGTPLLVIECAIGSDHSGTAILRPAHGYQNGSLLSRRTHGMQLAPAIGIPRILQRKPW